MPLVCEISIEAYCRRIGVIRPLINHAFNRMSPIFTLYAQLRPVYTAFPARWLPVHVRLTRYSIYKQTTYMPLVCEISIDAYCRPNCVIRSLSNHASNRLSPDLNIFAQERPVHTASPPR
jgi:hypothetical protein